jgi:hypothetical protein
MPKASTPSYVVELQLERVSREEDRSLWGMFEASKRLANVMLQHGIEVVTRMRADPDWTHACALPKKTKPQLDARRSAFAALRTRYRFSEYEFHKVVARHKNAAGFKDRIGANVAQKIATRVFKSCQKWLMGLGGKPRFKGLKRPLHSVEEKNTTTGIRWEAEAQTVQVMGMRLKVKLPDLRKDEWLAAALQSKTKYCRLLWRHVGTRRQYVLQLVQEGMAPIKASVLNRLAPEHTVGGLDLGPSNYGWVTQGEAGLEAFCPEVAVPEREIKNLQRHIDRQRRANNPENYDQRGRAKRGRTWVVSRRQRQTEAQLRGTLGTLVRVRKNSHGRMTNHLLSKALAWRDDDVSLRSLQKNYGRSVGSRAPGMFMESLKRKAARAGASRRPQDSRQLKTSQYDHSLDLYRKKHLSERWHVFGDGRGRVQRDVYSAFLARNALEKIDADGVVRWEHDPVVLEAAWQTLLPTLRESTLYVPKDLEAGEGDRIVPVRSWPHEINRESEEAVRSSPKPGRPARRVVSAKAAGRLSCRTTGLNDPGQPCL